MKNTQHRILMVYPETPVTFWSFKGALQFIAKRSAEPPLGLVTLAAMLPEEWDIKLVDMNVRPLRDDHLSWADTVFLSGMNIHKASFRAVVRRCNALGKTIVAGGPMVTTDHHEFMGVDSFVIGEAEAVIDELAEDLSNGTLKQFYQAEGYPDIRKTPVPRWDLLELKKYASMSMQYSRGCPFNCEFCSITFLNGRKPRVKESSQFIAELESLYKAGWRGSVFVVDDNFIGNIAKVKRNLLPALTDWSRAKHYPFKFMTEASVNLADDDELIESMVNAGFDAVFIGIETPDEKSLAACGKKQNVKGDMVSAVGKLHRSGLMVSGGFIVGFDEDQKDIFERQIQFIRNSRIVTAMVGLLNAPTGSRLFQRLKQENRIIESMSGDNMDGSMNFIPRMDYKLLVQGYHKILNTIYSHKDYYQRVVAFLNEYRPPVHGMKRIQWAQIRALLRSFWVLGIRERGRQYYWKLLGHTLIRYPRKIVLAVTLAIYGYHFRLIVNNSD
jgi:radical SAM superfamily enzyme YgiQ (UPF0313 family)